MLEEIFDDLIGDPLPTENDDEELIELEDEDANEEIENDFVRQTLPQSDNIVQPKKKKPVRKPQPKLDAERLKGPRGLLALENEFAAYNFKGPGYEKEDLDEVMKRLENWTHKLFPVYQFDDCLEKLEQLGHKKPVATYIKKIRMGLETAESAQMQTNLMNEVEDEDPLAVPFDPFDDLITQQSNNACNSRATPPQPKPPNVSHIEKICSSSETAGSSHMQKDLTNNAKSQDGSILSDSLNECITQQLSDAGIYACTLPQPNPQKKVLSDELRERIERNRQAALQRKLARQKQRENHST